MQGIGPWGCGISLRLGRNEADVVRSIRPPGVINTDIEYNKENKQSDVQEKRENQTIKLLSLKINNESVVIMNSW